MKKKLVQLQTVDRNGFTLVELLVVIGIIGGLAALLLTNFVGIRGRAADAAKKSDLDQLKKSLRLYYNDFQVYPVGSGGAILGCGADGDASCTSGGEFSAGGTVYMKQLPIDVIYYSDGDEGFVALAELDNASDADIAISQGRCDPEARPYFSDTLSALDYVVCED